MSSSPSVEGQWRTCFVTRAPTVRPQTKCHKRDLRQLDGRPAVQRIKIPITRPSLTSKRRFLRQSHKVCTTVSFTAAHAARIAQASAAQKIRARRRSSSLMAATAAPFHINSPLVHSPVLSDLLQCPVYLKLDITQPSGISISVPARAPLTCGQARSRSAV